MNEDQRETLAIEIDYLEKVLMPRSDWQDPNSMHSARVLHSIFIDLHKKHQEKGGKGW
jgi:hypothetical protein